LAIFLLKERLDAYRIFGLFFGLSGLAVLVVPELQAIAAAPLGVLAILGASVSWALGTVLMKRFTWSISTTALAGWQLLIAAVFVSSGALLVNRQAAWAENWSLPELLGTLYAITFAMAFGHWAWFRIVRIFPAPVAAIGTM